MLVAATIGGAIGSAVALAVARGFSSPPVAQSEPERQRDTKDQSESNANEDPLSRDDDVTRRVGQLERRVRVLTAAIARGPAPDESAEGARSPRTLDVADPVFEVAVMDIIDRVDEQKEDERDERRAEMRRQFADRMSTQLEESLALTPEQKIRVGEVIQRHFDAIRALHDADDRPVTRADWRERAAAIRAESERKLGEVLSPEQMTTYRELDDEEKIGGGWSRGRGRR